LFKEREVFKYIFYYKKKMNAIPIHQWNPITVASGEVKASFYIKPSLLLLQFLNRNVGNGNRMSLVKVEGTNNPIYDGGELFAIVDTSANVPNNRQNFFRETGYYVVTLALDWFGYPPQNGTVSFLEGIIGHRPAPEKIIEPFQELADTPADMVSDASDASNTSDNAPSWSPKKCGLSKTTLLMVAVALITLCAVGVYAKN